MTPPIKNPPQRLRQRARKDGSWRIWWEPETPLRELGFEPVALKADQLTWSVREAERLNDLVDQARGKPARKAPTRGRTVQQLIAAYLQSPRFATRAPATQRDYRSTMSLIANKWGGSLIVDFNQPIMVEWYEALYAKSGPYVAASMLRKMSILMGYAKRRGWRTDNPCLDMGRETPPRRHRVATWDELDALLAAARTKGLHSMELAIALAVFQGQRQADIIQADRHAFADQVWRLRRQKRGNTGAMSVHPEVLPLLEAMIARAGERERLLHYEGTAARPADLPYSSDLFRSVWTRVRATAAETQPTVAGLQFRDLRRTFGHLARLGGADVRAVADALGNKAHVDAELSQVYMPPTLESASAAVGAIRRPKKRQS